jgi:hypothetical protein
MEIWHYGMERKYGFTERNYGMEIWIYGTMKKWNYGTELWNGNMDLWNHEKVELWKNIIQKINLYK